MFRPKLRLQDTKLLLKGHLRQRNSIIVSVAAHTVSRLSRRDEFHFLTYKKKKNLAQTFPDISLFHVPLAYIHFFFSFINFMSLFSD